ncbi:hypothetical protein P4571_01725 [Niallia alba]|uniref:hypothetical protein n=1 Tax=Niallia alba TaxID=2729105 RepID=UPI000C757BC7|nr:hypothetical protein [Niallia alba]MED3791164.1 hypothetical protein [Niallia alba]
MFIRHILFLTLLISLLTTTWPMHGMEDFKASTHHDEFNYSMSELKDTIRNIQSKADINSNLGMKHEVVRGDMYNNVVWRFDLGSQPTYQFVSENDSIDMEGLQERTIKYIVFLSFGEDEETIISKSIYYCDENGAIHEVKYIENIERENIILPPSK